MNSALVIRSALLFLLALVFLLPFSYVEAAGCSQNLTIIPKGFVQNDTLKFKFGVGVAEAKAKQNLTIEYWVEDVDGGILKAKRQSPNLDWKTFTPKTTQLYSLYAIKAAIIQPGGESCPAVEQLVVFKSQINSSSPDEAKLICKPLKKGISIYLEHVPETVIAGEPFRIIAGIENHDNTTQDIEIYSYVYRASKTYSGSRTGNMIKFELAPAGSAELELIDTINSSLASPGEYKLKLIARYSKNKTKELTANITIIQAQANDRKIWISHFGLGALSKPELIAEINSTSKHDADLKLVMESDTDIIEAELTLQPEEAASVKFPLSLPLAKNHLFLKLYQDSSLIDISELVLENSSAKAILQKPFNLVNGDIILNTSENIYSSSSSKSAALVPFLLLAASLILNLYFIFYKKKE